MIAIGGSIDVRGVDLGLERMGDKRLVGAIARELKKPLRADQRAHARDQAGPDGKWPKRKLGGRRRVLGKLPNAVRVVARRGMVSAESRVPWSGAHQDGDKVGRGATLPARRFLWISDDMLQLANDHAAERVAGAY